MREIELLREAMTVYGLSPERAATYLEVHSMTIRRWLAGDNEPNGIYQKAIVAGVEKMKAVYEPKILEKGGAWFGNLSGDPKEPDPAEVADIARCEAISPLFGELMKVVSDNERPLVERGWVDFAELLALCMKYNVKLPE